MRYLLDTNVCVDVLRGRDQATFDHMRTLPIDDVAISAITLAELAYGAARSQRPEHNRLCVVEFCVPLAILPFNGPAAESYGQVRAALEAVGTPIDLLDTLIAAHALSRDLVVVTSNLREFHRVRGLRAESWRGI